MINPPNSSRISFVSCVICIFMAEKKNDKRVWNWRKGQLSTKYKIRVCLCVCVYMYPLYIHRNVCTDGWTDGWMAVSIYGYLSIYVAIMERVGIGMLDARESLSWSLLSNILVACMEIGKRFTWRVLEGEKSNVYLCFCIFYTLYINICRDQSRAIPYNFSLCRYAVGRFGEKWKHQ